MIENALQWAGVTGVEKMVDVGCGIGGSSRHIARKFGCAATGTQTPLSLTSRSPLRT
jgi:tocopherol O-methyltransferase